MSSIIKVLDDGHIQLVASCGDDLSIVNAARASYKKYNEKLTAADEKLIDYLIRNKHSTPLEMVDFTFQVKAPKPVVAEWERHRWSSFNEASSRYVEFKNEFYYPSGAALRKQVGKPGHYEFEEIVDPEVKSSIEFVMNEAYIQGYNRYKALLDLGLAKEVARNVLPFGFYTEFFYKANLRSIFNFISLRNDDRALLEIREYAKVIEHFVAQIVPIAYNSFISNGRIAP